MPAVHTSYRQTGTEGRMNNSQEEPNTEEWLQVYTESICQSNTMYIVIE